VPAQYHYEPVKSNRNRQTGQPSFVGLIKIKDQFQGTEAVFTADGNWFSRPDGESDGLKLAPVVFKGYRGRIGAGAIFRGRI
jgi:hypothetical protein